MQVWLQSGSDWPQKGQIQGFFRSDFSSFGAPAPNALKSDLEKPRICPIWGQSDPLWSQTYHPWSGLHRQTTIGSQFVNFGFGPHKNLNHQVKICNFQYVNINYQRVTNGNLLVVSKYIQTITGLLTFWVEFLNTVVTS